MLICNVSSATTNKTLQGCSKCGHIEDVVVDSTYRGLRLGLRIIEALMKAAEVGGAGWVAGWRGGGGWHEGDAGRGCAGGAGV